MTIIWVQQKSQRVEDAVTAVAQALDEAKQSPVEAPPEELFMGDTYLAENVGAMRAGWEINPWAIVSGGTGRLGRAFEFVQRVARRLSWWYTRPQVDQTSRFNAATVRALEGILARVLRITQRIHEIEATHSESRLRGFDEQLRQAREEQLRLQQRVVTLEAELEALRKERPRGRRVN